MRAFYLHEGRMENAVDEPPAHRLTLVDPQSAKTSMIANKSVIVRASRPGCSSDFLIGDKFDFFSR